MTYSSNIEPQVPSDVSKVISFIDLSEHKNNLRENYLNVLNAFSHDLIMLYMLQKFMNL